MRWVGSQKTNEQSKSGRLDSRQHTPSCGDWVRLTPTRRPWIAWVVTPRMNEN